MSKVLEVSSLCSHSLDRLLNDEVYVLIIRSYSEVQLCKRVAQLIQSSSKIEKYMYELSDNGTRKSLFLGVSRLGTSYSTTFGKSKTSFEFEKYYTDALKSINHFRDFFSPFLSPIDKLRLNLDEIFNFGATIASFDNKRMFTGIARITHPGMDLQEKNPHVDSLPENIELLKQFSANIYLDTPDDGGELVVYPVPPMSQIDVDDFEKNQLLWASKLPVGIEIKPQPGDLILINTRRPHAVKSFSIGSRVSIQTFIGFNPNESLKLWC